MTMDDNTGIVLALVAVALIVAAVSFARAWAARADAAYEPERLRAEADLIRAKSERGQFRTETKTTFRTPDRSEDDPR